MKVILKQGGNCEIEFDIDKIDYMINTIYLIG